MTQTTRALPLLLSKIAPFRDGAWDTGAARRADWDSAVRRRTELCLLDSLTCFSAGLSLAHFAPTITVARQMFGIDASNKSGAGLSPFAQAYLYGQAANSLDYDDTLLGHPGTPIVGAVLAVGAQNRLPTDRLLRGIAAGYEAHWFFASSAAPSNERAAQVRSVGIWDAIAASVGICVALGLDDQMTERAISIAVAHSLLPYTGKWYERPVPAMKNNLGWAAAGAVMSVELAIAGQTGVTNAFEGDTGMWRMAGSDQWDIKRSDNDKPAVMRTGFKHFPVCWHIQLFLKNFAELFAKVSPQDEVTEIIAAGQPDVEKFCQPEIFEPADVAFSLPAAFSLVMSGVEAGPEWDLIDENSEALRFRNLFRYEPSENRSLTLRTRQGAELKTAVAISSSTDLAPSGLDEAGVLAKHKRLTNLNLQKSAATALADQATQSVIPDALYQQIAAMLANEPVEHRRTAFA